MDLAASAVVLMVQFLGLQPFIPLQRVGLYLVAACALLISMYFLTYSGWYWISHAQNKRNAAMVETARPTMNGQRDGRLAPPRTPPSSRPDSDSP